MADGIVQPPNFNFGVFDALIGLIVFLLIIGVFVYLSYSLIKTRYPIIRAIVFDKGLIYRKQFYELDQGKFTDDNLIQILLKKAEPKGSGSITDYAYLHEPVPGGAFRTFLMAKLGSKYVPVQIIKEEKQTKLINEQVIAAKLYEEALAYFIHAQEHVKAFDQLMARLIEVLPISILAILIGAIFWLAGTILHDNYTQLTKANQEIATLLKQTSDNLILIHNETKNQTAQLKNEYEKYLEEINKVTNISIGGVSK